MTKSEVVSKLLKPQEGKHLGDIVNWSLRGGKRQDHVRDLAKKHGLEDDLGFPKLNAASAYRRSVKLSVRGGRMDERKLDVVKLEETDDKIVHAIVEKNVVEKLNATAGGLTTKDAEFETELIVGFDKKALKDGEPVEDLLKIGKGSSVLAQTIIDRYESLVVQFLPEDIRIAFQRAFNRWGAIGLSENGGIWWVPAPYAGKVRAWKQFMLDLNMRPLIFPQYDFEETIQGLREQSIATLEGQMAKIMDDLTSFTSKDNTRTSTLEKRVEMFDDLRNRIELHCSVLGYQQNELLDKLNIAQSSLMKSLEFIEG